MLPSSPPPPPPRCCCLFLYACVLPMVGAFPTMGGWAAPQIGGGRSGTVTGGGGWPGWRLGRWKMAWTSGSVSLSHQSSVPQFSLLLPSLPFLPHLALCCFALAFAFCLLPIGRGGFLEICLLLLLQKTRKAGRIWLVGVLLKMMTVELEKGMVEEERKEAGRKDWGLATAYSSIILCMHVTCLLIMAQDQFLPACPHLNISSCLSPLPSLLPTICYHLPCNDKCQNILFRGGHSSLKLMWETSLQHSLLLFLCKHQ